MSGDVTGDARGHDELRNAAGPWVLGALDEDEAWRFAAHLEVCATCRAEVTRLQVAADALPLAAAPVEPPPELRERLMAIVEAEARERTAQQIALAKRDRRIRLRIPRLVPTPALAAAAVCAAIVGGVTGFALGGGSSPRTRTVVAHVDTGLASGARAQLLQTGSTAVLRVSSMPSPAAGRVYEVWIDRPGNRAPEPDAVFTVDRDGQGSVAVRGDLRGASEVLVTDEPEGGSTAPTGRQVIVARPV